MLIVGIDPGLSGAIASIDSGREGEEILNTLGVRVEIVDIPTLRSGVGNRRELDVQATVKIIRELRNRYSTVEGTTWSVPREKIIIGLEKVHSMPRQGVASTFAFGKVYGTLIGILGTLGLPYSLVTPQTWRKSVMEGMPKGKDSSIQRCHELFPEVDCITKKSHHNRADALLIAEHMSIIATTGGGSE